MFLNSPTFLDCPFSSSVDVRSRPPEVVRVSLSSLVVSFSGAVVVTSPWTGIHLLWTPLAYSFFPFSSPCDLQTLRLPLACWRGLPRTLTSLSSSTFTPLCPFFHFPPAFFHRNDQTYDVFFRARTLDFSQSLRVENSTTLPLVVSLAFPFHQTFLLG